MEAVAGSRHFSTLPLSFSQNKNLALFFCQINQAFLSFDQRFLIFQKLVRGKYVTYLLFGSAFSKNTFSDN